MNEIVKSDVSNHIEGFLNYYDIPKSIAIAALKDVIFRLEGKEEATTVEFTETFKKVVDNSETEA
ncbi:hypothetical protein [Ralstonia phage RSP15]|uniref:hypothetical protein n=1 Tax=Ralstonia phage RSP15 TaxID=1785960 RepID=UPI00074D4BD7|nr:hypothetical protein BH754_gp202 [Ralstonia phage RSP15]BAU40104.1 hypothetical protein [Ralstonia phage RSP15]